MQGKIVVITGSTSGIGQVAAEKLAAMGARIVLVARHKSRGEATLARLRSIPPPTGGRAAAHSVYYADLSRLRETKRVAREIAAAEPRIDVLINNAGAAFSRYQVTEDGLELTFATNHMSYFVLTHGLREQLLAAAPARIVNTASDAHKGARLDFSDLQLEGGYGGLKAYSRSKLCNILFTRELSRRLAGTGVVANSLHPGFVNTRIGDQNGGLVSGIFRFMKQFALTPEKGAETIVYLASAEDARTVSGQYFVKCRAVAPSKAAQDDEAARRLWEESVKLAGLADNAAA